ncbi:acyl-CoA carboxylase subunit epsilon [Streptomyces sp. MA15]|uniref:acyl-CoA carboxylase subunit epsilon n=1 Tax=Streptomyces sp. MA15 TaxID=3055061 RepID=UPI0025AF756E|nr:acyl-CoA carboxylase subunit epsilon [Streptomyces sp. MA15]MDN3271655.1 acyl-CoA carboxylase subunit epsilon [Streptomyces sp. MA15]
MGEPGSLELALRIERGRADEDELAAVVLVLCSVLAGRGGTGAGGVPSGAPSRRRPQWPPVTYRSPRSWR